MDWRLRGLPPALWRRVRDKAGDNLHAVLLGLLCAYADGEIDPLRSRQTEDPRDQDRRTITRAHADRDRRRS